MTTKKQLKEELYNKINRELEDINEFDFLYIKSQTQYFRVYMTIMKTKKELSDLDKEFLKVEYFSYGGRWIRKKVDNLSKRDLEILNKFFVVIKAIDYLNTRKSYKYFS